MPEYTYMINGTGAHNQAWFTLGVVVSSGMNAAIDAAKLASLGQLAQGKAVYGPPGVICEGPYKITRFFLELVNSDK